MANCLSPKELLDVFYEMNVNSFGRAMAYLTLVYLTNAPEDETREAVRLVAAPLKDMNFTAFQTGCFFRETFLILRNNLAIDCSTKKCEYSFALDTRYGCVPKFVGQNRFFHFV